MKRKVWLKKLTSHHPAAGTIRQPVRWMLSSAPLCDQCIRFSGMASATQIGTTTTSSTHIGKKTVPQRQRAPWASVPCKRQVFKINHPPSLSIPSHLLLPPLPPPSPTTHPPTPVEHARSTARCTCEHGLRVHVSCSCISNKRTSMTKYSFGSFIAPCFVAHHATERFIFFKITAGNFCRQKS